MTALAASVRQIMLFKSVSVLKMQDLVANLQTNKTAIGEFSSDVQRTQMVVKLAKLCPEWIQIRDVCGRQVVKVDQKMNAFKINELISSRLA